MVCSCCGLQRDQNDVAALACRDDITICRDCIGWLSARAGCLDVTPTLPVSDMASSKAFFERAGFDVRLYDGGFAFVTAHDQSVFDLDLISDLDASANHAGCYIITGSADSWHAHMTAAGLQVSPIEDKPWGMHEFTLTDADGNNIRIGRNLSTD